MKSNADDIDPDGRYTVSQAARLLNVHRSTVSRFCKKDAKEGGIKFSVNRRNGRKTILGKDLLKWWKGH